MKLVNSVSKFSSSSGMPFGRFRCSDAEAEIPSNSLMRRLSASSFYGSRQKRLFFSTIFRKAPKSPKLCQYSLRDLLDEQGIVLPTYVPGQHRLLCPQCHGGSSREKSLALKLESDGSSAVWVCHRARCGWTGSAKESFSDESFHFPLRRPMALSVSASSVSSEGNSSDTEAPPGSPQSPSRSGSLQQASQRPPSVRQRWRKPQKLSSLKFEPLDAEMQEFFSVRGISRATWERNQVAQEDAFSPIEGRVVKAMVFPYLREGEIVNCKYRAPKKQFWQVKGGDKVLYGLDDIKGQQTIIIVEGEMDKLAVEEAGIRYCVSVPDGAPNPKSKPSNDNKVPEILGGTLQPQDKKYEYLWACRAYLDKATRIVLATDTDEPGQALAEELARRLGRERCWRVRWPQREDGELCKDANEVLLELGAPALLEALGSAEPFPIRGLFRFREYFAEIEQHYLSAEGLQRGASSGWSALDPLYRVVPGELTVVTGVPNSGKSEWIDALLCNLCLSEGWTFALCSMENRVKDHARKLIEKYTGEPFFSVDYAPDVARLSPSSLAAGKQWLDEHFHLIRCEDDELPSIDWLLGLARAAVLRHGIRGLVIDPYNELDHQRGASQTETEYVSQMLTKVKRFAQHHDCHVWFVAHPKQLQQWKGDPPGLYDISGSAHFVNKCDNGIVVHRNRDPEQGPLDHVKILVRKVRNKAAGTVGEAVLRYDRVNGRYKDLEGSQGS